VTQLDLMRFGVFQARRAGLTKADVINTLPAARLEAAIARPARGAAGAKAKRAAKPNGAATRASKPRAPRKTARRPH
jgi:hypothetical protein